MKAWIDKWFPLIFLWWTFCLPVVGSAQWMAKGTKAHGPMTVVLALYLVPMTIYVCHLQEKRDDYFHNRNVRGEASRSRRNRR